MKPEKALWASDLGWKPGFWPIRFEYDRVEYEFLRQQDKDGDLLFCLYRCINNNNRLILVFND